MPEVVTQAARSARSRGRLATLIRARAGLIGRLLRFGTGAVVATVCSQATFFLLYGPAAASTTVASVLAWIAGAIPNYWINRAWTWGRRGRPSLRRELVPYAAIVLAVAALLEGTSVSHGARTGIVTGTYFMVYAVMFGFRFLLFDRLFGTREVSPGR
jgi:putative flippase GtrA